MAHQGFGFCEFLTEEDAEYACKIMNQIKLWGKPIRVNKASSDKKQLDVGANLFISSLDKNVDKHLLYDTFSAFGMMATTAKIACDPQTGQSKGYGFVSYTDFESADAAIEPMNGQFLMNKPITSSICIQEGWKGAGHEALAAPASIPPGPLCYDYNPYSK
ncbi:splicing factor 3b, subunit 4, 49kDa [Lactarius hengduanensis]|nr:splicing factor 3b, subunit 4, 49kDa [Lactarius hengduanensis]